MSSQELNNQKERLITADQDTIVLDTLSLAPNSVFISDEQGNPVDPLFYSVDYAKALLIIKAPDPNKQWKVRYRRLPLFFNKKYFHKSPQLIEEDDPGKPNYYSIQNPRASNDVFKLEGLNKNGSISRGVSFGNNQDLSVNSNLDLQLSGKVTEEISVLAAITDNNIPIQPDGNTQQLQEFDQVYIQLYTDQYKLKAGDFQLTRPNSYFMNFNKRAQGGSFEARVPTGNALDSSKMGLLTSRFSIAISKGKFSRNIFDGVEGNQGPYRLRGADGEEFIIVLSGTERVYVDGRLLKRGQEYDYIIDYNLSEVTFTPNQLITKNQRIVIEFQYSERNFGRSLIHQETNYKKDRLELNFNFYSEQDNKNQPLLQELNDEEEELLQRIGDRLNQAVISGIDSVAEFENDQVLYALVDTLGFDSVLVYSTDPERAKYRARFSQVGANQGNYVRVNSTANGRVYEWRAPVNGVPQGDHEPVILLITPKRRQMVTLGGRYQLAQYTNIAWEGVYTQNDLNTFSSRDRGDDRSYGFRFVLDEEEHFQGKEGTAPTVWRSDLSYEQRGTNFQFIERYRSVEFDRDWNIRGLNLEGNEYLVNASSGLRKKDVGAFNLRGGLFVKGDDYTGLRYGMDGKYRLGDLSIETRGSYTTAEAIENNSAFLRHYTTVQQKLGGYVIGVYAEQERISLRNVDNDSLQVNSLDRQIYKAFIRFKDSSRNNFELSYSQFYDFLPKGRRLEQAFFGENFDFSFELQSNPRSRLSGKATYRQLRIEDPELTTQPPENTLLGRLDYDLKIKKGLISSNTYYQVGSGLEVRREFSYLEVNDGQGVYLWRDYNDNGIKELNEFEIAGANNQFEANYIRVFTPTNEFIRVFSNQFNQVLFLRPEVVWATQSAKWKKLLSKFSNKAAYRIESRTQNEDDIYNPFDEQVDDSSLITINSSFANTFYFNRLSAKFGMDFFYLNNKSKSLLVNGFESRELIQREIRGRYNINRIFTFEGRLTESERSNGSEFFSNRNFRILSREAEPKLIYQPTVKFRLQLNLIYADKENRSGLERSINRTFGSEVRFNEAGKGSISASVNFINISFNAPENSSLAFEMLEGLQAGGNTTWSLGWQRNLSNNLQLNINYNGRKSEGLRTIHSGGMQVRAFF